MEWVTVDVYRLSSDVVVSESNTWSRWQYFEMIERDRWDNKRQASKVWQHRIHQVVVTAVGCRLGRWSLQGMRPVVPEYLSTGSAGSDTCFRLSFTLFSQPNRKTVPQAVYAFAALTISLKRKSYIKEGRKEISQGRRQAKGFLTTFHHQANGGMNPPLSSTVSA